MKIKLAKMLLLVSALLYSSVAFTQPSETFVTIGHSTHSSLNANMACSEAQRDAVTKAEDKCDSINSYAGTVLNGECYTGLRWIFGGKAKYTLTFTCRTKF